MKKNKHTLGVIIITIILMLYVFSLFLPLFWGIITSLKDSLDYINNPLGFPNKWEFNNYKTAIKYFYVPVEIKGQEKIVYIGEMFLNSLLYSVGGAFISTFVTCIVAYATARFDFKFSKVVYWIVIITMILPIVGSLASEKNIVESLGLYDSMLGMYLLKANFLGLYYLVFYAAFSKIPKDFEEAAIIDGASNFQVMTKVMLPMVSKLFTTIMLIKFIDFWNDYQTPLIYLPTKPTIAVGLLGYSQSYIYQISSPPMKLAGALIVFVPILILFIFLQKRLIGGISSVGGIKE